MQLVEWLQERSSSAFPYNARYSGSFGCCCCCSSWSSGELWERRKFTVSGFILNSMISPLLFLLLSRLIRVQLNWIGLKRARFLIVLVLRFYFLLHCKAWHCTLFCCHRGCVALHAIALNCIAKLRFFLALAKLRSSQQTIKIRAKRKTRAANCQSVEPREEARLDCKVNLGKFMKTDRASKLAFGLQARLSSRAPSFVKWRAHWFNFNYLSYIDVVRGEFSRGIEWRCVALRQLHGRLKRGAKLFRYSLGCLLFSVGESKSRVEINRSWFGEECTGWRRVEISLQLVQALLRLKRAQTRKIFWQ